MFRLSCMLQIILQIVNTSLYFTRDFTVINRFDIIRKLGQGTYGKVQLAVNKDTGQEVSFSSANVLSRFFLLHQIPRKGIG